VLIVLTNCPDAEVADRIARALVEQKLAACVNRMPAVDSVYRWQGAVERAVEVPLLIKSTRERLPEVQEAIRALHPYEVPEILAIPVVAGLPAYLRWVVDETQPPLLA
jgi:periplasmic divalent cation tolerance protein